MRSVFRILLLSVLCVGLSYCSLFSSKKDEGDPAKPEADLPKYENYHSSGVYKDIEKASADRAPSSEEYKDDEYGEVAGGSAEDEELLSESEPEQETDPLPNDEPANHDGPMLSDAGEEESADEPGETPLPNANPSKKAKAVKAAKAAKVAKAEKSEKSEKAKASKKDKKVASVSGFKSGMYPVSTNCTMRAKPNKSAKSMGTVDAGKKLWMEKHNDEWVKVFKKSGPVYLNKVCL